MVPGVLWTSLHIRWFYNNLRALDSHTGQHDRLLCYIQTSRAPIYTIPYMGQYRILPELQYITVKLTPSGA